MKSEIDTIFVKRIGHHHFAFLRSLAEGLDLQESAMRYLGIEHGHQARIASDQTIQAIRAIARRQNEAAWRLIGLTIRSKGVEQRQVTLEEFIESRNLDGWSESEVIEMYQEACGEQPKPDRRTALRKRQLDLLQRIQTINSEDAKDSDLVSGWFDTVTAKKLMAAGLITLGHILETIKSGGQWYRNLPAVGVGKANRIAAHLRLILPNANWTATNLFVAQGDRAPTPLQPSMVLAPPALPALATVDPVTNAGRNAVLAAESDTEAVEAWINARAGSLPTVKAYRKESRRFLLWLSHEKNGKGLAGVKIEDCRDYMAFLQAIPAHWISRVHASPQAPGWAPYRGQLSHNSQAQAVVIVSSMFIWLAAAEYLNMNPWMLVNQKTGDDKNAEVLDSKAFDPELFAKMLAYFDEQKPSPSRDRIKFIFLFLESVGLRSTELVSAKLGDFTELPEGWVLKVHGKGAKNRIVTVPGQARRALSDYLLSREIHDITTADPELPLIASTTDNHQGIGYHALYMHVKSWITKAVRAADLSNRDNSKFSRASTHWLRHTFGTRAIAMDVPLDVIQVQMGHASIQTATAIYGRAPIKRRNDELGKAFE